MGRSANRVPRAGSHALHCALALMLALANARAEVPADDSKQKWIRPRFLAGFDIECGSQATMEKRSTPGKKDPCMAINLALLSSLKSSFSERGAKPFFDPADLELLEKEEALLDVRAVRAGCRVLVRRSSEVWARERAVWEGKPVSPTPDAK